MPIEYLPPHPLSRHAFVRVMYDRYRLSQRPAEVLYELLAHGGPHKQIARRLGIDTQTIKNYMLLVREKMGVDSTLDVIKLVYPVWANYPEPRALKVIERAVEVKVDVPVLPTVAAEAGEHIAVMQRMARELRLAPDPGMIPLARRCDTVIDWMQRLLDEHQQEEDEYESE